MDEVKGSLKQMDDDDEFDDLEMEIVAIAESVIRIRNIAVSQAAVGPNESALMSPCKSFQCRQLDAISIFDWLHLTSPLLRSYASVALRAQGTNKDKFLALALESEAYTYAGLLLAEVIDLRSNDEGNHQYLCILSVVVAKPFRRCGLGHYLLNNAKHWAKSHHLDGLHLQMPLSSSSSEAMLRLTSDKQGWTASSGKIVVGLSVSYSVESLLKRLENVVNRQARHATWQMTAFSEQHTAKLQKRMAMSSNGQVATPWDPDGEDYQWKPAMQYSRLLWHQGEIIGWLMTHFVSIDCLRYAKFWVDRGWERTGAPLAMLTSVMRSAHFNKDTEVVKKGCLIFHPASRQLYQLIKKQFKPVSDSWVEIENRHLIFPVAKHSPTQDSHTESPDS